MSGITGAFFRPLALSAAFGMNRHTDLWISTAYVGRERLPLPFCLDDPKPNIRACYSPRSDIEPRAQPPGRALSGSYWLTLRATGTQTNERDGRLRLDACIVSYRSAAPRRSRQMYGALRMGRDRARATASSRRVRRGPPEARAAGKARPRAASVCPRSDRRSAIARHR